MICCILATHRCMVAPSWKALMERTWPLMPLEADLVIYFIIVFRRAFGIVSNKLAWLMPMVHKSDKKTIAVTVNNNNICLWKIENTRGHSVIGEDKNCTTCDFFFFMSMSVIFSSCCFTSKINFLILLYEWVNKLQLGICKPMSSSECRIIY